MLELGRRLNASAGGRRLRPAPVRCAPSPQQAAPSTQQQPEWYIAVEPHIGPLELKTIPGRGRGVVATEDIAMGDALIISPPVAIVNSAPGLPRADGDQLVDHILEQGAWQRAWFNALTDGTPASCITCPDIRMPHDTQQQEQDDASSQEPTQTMTDGKSQGFAERKSKVSRSKAKSKKPLTAPHGLDRRALRRIAMRTKLNCYGDNHEDLALCELRSEEARGHIGIWGPFAMLNHSCAPNAINYVVGDSMVVRATSAIPKGSEILISYLGRPQLWPVELRRAELKENYGFECDCDRCKLELTHIDKLDPSQYDELYARVHSRMQEQYQSAVQEGDREELETLYGDLQGSLNSLNQQFRRALISPTARLYLIASLFEVIELTVDLARELGLVEERVYQLGQAVRCLEAVTAGSDLHCITTAQHHAAQLELHGSPQAPQVQSALAQALDAHRARYGPLSQARLEQLMELNRTLYH